MRIVLVLLTILYMSVGSIGYCMQDPATGEEIKGYKGDLPDLTQGFKHRRPVESRPIYDQVEPFDIEKLKPAPLDNPAFVNIMRKKDTRSDYTLDVYELIPMVESVLNAIDAQMPIQIFSAKVNYLYDNVEFFRKKYATKPEQYYDSYSQVIQAANQARVVCALRTERELYTPYLALSEEGADYSPNNIERQIQYLYVKLEEALVFLKAVE